MIGLLLALISLFTVEVALAQTGIDGQDTPHMNCSLGGMDFNLNSSVRVCHPGTNSFGQCCSPGFSCGPAFTPTPTPCDCAVLTPTPVPTPT